MRIATVTLTLNREIVNMKQQSEMSVDPGGGFELSLEKKVKNRTSTSSDSDSGLSWTNGESNGESGSDRESEQNLIRESKQPDDHGDEIIRPRKIPFMGLALRTNKLSQIAKNEQKIKYQCYECGNTMAKRQPLVKTNGILFMKNREEVEMNGFQYDDLTDCAFTRSEIVKGWNIELREHIGYCSDEIGQMAHYQTKFNEKYKIIRKNSFSPSEKSQISETSSQTSENNQPVETVEKVSKISKFLSKINKQGRSRSRDTSKIQPDPENCFEPPPAARPKPKRSSPSVKIRPPEATPEVNFSGKVALTSTVLREHCESCVLRNKPEEFQSVLFVCQL